MAMYYLTVAMTMIPLGFVIFIWGIDKGNNTNTYAGAIIIAIAIATWIYALRLTTKEQKQERDDRTRQHSELIAELKGVCSDIKNSINELVNEIRLDREERRQRGQKNDKCNHL